MKKYVIGAAILVVIIIMVMMSGRPDNNEATENTVNTPEVSKVTVEVEEAITGEITRYISETGSTSPLQSTVIASEVSGKIVETSIEVGKYISKNEVIASIDDEIIRLSHEQAKAQVINAAASFEKAEKDLERYKILLDKNEISDGEFEQIKLQYELSRAARMTAEASEQSTARQLRNTKIKSPINGQIAEKYVQSGDMLSPGARVIKIVDNSKIRVNINLSESDVVNLKKGSIAEVRIDAFRDKVFKGTIFTISPEGNSSSHTFPVEIILTNQDFQIKSGMIARVNILSETINNAILIPRESVIERFGGNVVYIVRDNKAVEKRIEIGYEQNNKLQVISGIEPGDLVVKTGQYGLENGTAVNVVK